MKPRLVQNGIADLTVPNSLGTYFAWSDVTVLRIGRPLIFHSIPASDMSVLD